MRQEHQDEHLAHVVVDRRDQSEIVPADVENHDSSSTGDADFIRVRKGPTHIGQVPPLPGDTVQQPMLKPGARPRVSRLILAETGGLDDPHEYIMYSRGRKSRETEPCFYWVRAAGLPRIRRR